MNKVEGNVETCQSCGTEVKCVMKPASGKYAGKLQWQNMDGKAHYFFDHTKPDGDKEQFKCVIPEEEVTDVPDEETIENTTPEPPKPQNVKVELNKTDSTIIVRINKEIVDIATIDRQVMEFLTANNTKEEFVSGEKVGLWTKLIYQYLSNQ